MRCCFSGSRYSRVRMLCRRSASFTITTRTSFTIARSIFRTFSACLASGASRSSRLILVAPSTSRATSGPNRREMCHFHRMREERLAGKPRLGLVLLGREIIRVPKQIEIVAWPVAAHFVEQLDETQVYIPARLRPNRRICPGTHLDSVTDSTLAFAKTERKRRESHLPLATE